MPVQPDGHGRYRGPILCKPPKSKTFHDGYLTLNPSHQKLTCHEKIRTDQPTQSAEDVRVLIEFDTSSIALVDRAQKEKQAFCFSISYLADVTYFATSTWKEMEDWMQIITESAQITVPKSDIRPYRASISGSYRADIVGGKFIKTSLDSIQKDGQTKNITDAKSTSTSFFARSASRASTPLADLSQLNVIKAGYCTKLGHLRKNWKRRYLVLAEDSLLYFKDEQEKKPLKQINICDIKDARTSDSNLMKENLIDVVTPYRTFHIQLDTTPEMYSWLEEIRKQANLVVMTYL